MNNNENRNYIKEYFMQENHDLTSVLKVDFDSDTKIKELKATMNRLSREINKCGEDLRLEVEKRYTNKFIPLEEKNIIKYEGRNGDYCFDLDSGLYVEDYEEKDNVYGVEKKIGEVSVVCGYNYETASVIIRTYSYNITKNNDIIKTKLLREYNVSFLGTKVAIVNNIETNEVEEKEYEELSWNYRCEIDSALKKIKNGTFINTLYGTDYKGEKSLYDLKKYYNDNKSFEIIIKTSPSEIVDDLLQQKLDSCIPIYKIIGVSQETYNRAISNGIIKLLWRYNDFINGSRNKDLKINKTENEWLDFLDEMNNYEKDLEFYGIKYSNYWNDNNRTLFETIIEKYTKSDYYSEKNCLSEFYSLGKFSNYVINETINQGYDNICDFINELRDYLSMCKKDNIKPTLYSSYLKQTHDITSRNHKVVVEKENEEMFKSRYSDFKEYHGKDYMVVAPSCSNDLKLEGDRLNHCVASYIKRVIDGDCLIFFLRKKKDESLITFEVRNNKIVQVRGLHNRKANKEENRALSEFAKYRKMEEFTSVD